jgi:preprotein translocase subunit SecE
MASNDEKDMDEPKEETAEVLPPEEKSIEAVEEGEERPTGMLGAARYVHAAFFLIAILGAYVGSKLLVLAWGVIAEVPTAVRYVPQLVAYAEDDREGITLLVGLVAGTVVVIHSYRKASIRAWADGVAEELSRVTWPTRDTVMNGTIVVVVASVIATVYVTVLDRFWGFLTTLVYGA